MITPPSEMDTYGKLKLGSRKFDDTTLDLKQTKKYDIQGHLTKDFVLKALVQNDTYALREISKRFYRMNGIYQKVINYYAYLYRYDWYMVPEIFSDSVNDDKVIKDFTKALHYLDATNIKKLCGEFALAVLRDGVYYGYAYEGKNGIIVQDLPWKWCRSRFKINGIPAIEFDMHFFDTTFPDINYRLRILDLFPDDFKKGYILYKKKKLPADNIAKEEYGHWYLLDSTCAFKFSFFGTNDIPIFVNAIPEIFDLQTTQGIDRQRQLQQLFKIIVQKLPLDKNGDLIFDVDEARDIHNNAVEMLARAIGVDVLTTFADIQAIEVSDANQSTKDETLNNAERTVYNALGVSKNLFNPEGNLALEKSILQDEGTLRDLVLQFENLFNTIIQKRSANPKKWNFRFYMLLTSQSNYQALAKLYKEQTTIGFSKMLPQIALGQSQSFILNTAFFENQVLYLSEIMIPPLMSSTMSSEDLGNLGNKNKSQINENQESSGRPPKEESELSDKTIQNKEAMS